MSNLVLIGLGGLGSPLALALAGAGRLVLVDDDVVDLSNLPRQILYRTEDVGRPKVQAAADALRRRGVTRVEPVAARFTPESLNGPVALEAASSLGQRAPSLQTPPSTGWRALLHDADLVLDGSDNLATKFLVNDACVAAGKPFVIGGVLGHGGQVFPVRPGRDACYRCLFEAPPEGDVESCADAGVLGPTCGIVAAWMARAALALLGGRDPHAVLGKLWILPEERPVSLRPRPGCCAPLAEVSA